MCLVQAFMCKSCTDNLSVWSRYTHSGTLTPETDHRNKVNPVRSSFAEACVCRRVIPRLCESPPDSKQCNCLSFICKCNSKYCLCMFYCHSSYICSYVEKALICALFLNDHIMSCQHQMKSATFCQVSVF